MARTAGELSKQNYYFEWRVADFFSLPESEDEFCESPTFQFSGDTWFLRMFPKGNKSSGCISLYLRNVRAENGSRYANFKLGLKKNDGSQYSQKAKHLFTEDEPDWGWSKFLQRSEISRAKDLMAPKNVLTFSCSITNETSVIEEAEQFVSSESGNMYYGEPSTTPKVLWGALSSNLKDLFLSQKNCDFTVQVEDEVFPVHRMILSARSTVLAAMLEHEMQESLSGNMEIFDASPSKFRDFLLFIYSGEVKALSSENVYDLYALADKYNVKDLKKECRSFMECTLSIDTVCDVLLLAEKYNEIQLKVSAEKYLVKNVANVMASDQWKALEAENHGLVIQLLKSIVLEKVSK